MAATPTSTVAALTKKPLRIGVIGPSGQCGSCVVDEALARGHNVVGISRNPPKTWKAAPRPDAYSSVSVDVRDHVKLREVFSSNFDAIVCAFAPPLSKIEDVYFIGVEANGKIKEALLASTHNGPFIIVGGAGSLHVAKNLQLVDQPKFVFSWWWSWPDVHLDYLAVRIREHGNFAFSSLIRLVQVDSRQPAKQINFGLITQIRIALTMWEGVTKKSWSFLSPPGMLRDKGIRTGTYKLHIDTADKASTEAVAGGIYNEDMAVAIVDEAENNKLAFTHWSCTGPIGLRKW
ncbi:hypothetical protein DFJ73DRAFT_960745 [Zopfochytrium polystomum]|nr:hypothetical protein DFJ73DRAFT_960745 [Zopfochytrium polystomum]